jgi:hypothetical protein
MKSLKIAFGLLIVAGSMAVTVGSALAGEVRWINCTENPGHGQWKNSLCSKAKTNGGWETKEISETVEVTSSAKELQLVDTKATGGEMKLACSVTDAGWVGATGSDGVSRVTTTECKLLEGKDGACESGKPVTAKAVHLPWSTKLQEATGGEARDAIQNGGKGEPGYAIECTVAGIFEVADECTGKTTTGIFNNKNKGTVEVEFESKSEKDNCILGGAGAGEIKGIAIVKQRNGRTLKVRGNVKEKPIFTGPAWIECGENEEAGQWDDSLCSKTKANGGWETQEVSEMTGVTSGLAGSEEIEFSDGLSGELETTLKCHWTSNGWIDSNGKGGINEASLRQCSLVKDGVCEPSGPLVFRWLNLPWETELREEAGEIRDLVRASRGKPEYRFECTVGIGLRLNSSCASTFTTGMTNNQTNGSVTAAFDEKSGWECGEGANRLKGTIFIKQINGHATKVRP